MSLSLGLVNANEQIHIHSYDQEGQVINKRLDLNEANDENIDILFLEDEASLEFAQEKSKFIPVRRAKDFHLDAENFQSLESDSAWSIFNNAQSTWTLSNNISLLNELFVVLDHLKKLYPNQRSTFFEELWFVLKRNLGTYDLKIIYNDIIKAKKDGQKDELIKNFVEGHSHPEIQRGEELEDKLMENYKAHFAETFEVCEYDAQKNEIVITANVNGSPILIMGRTNNLTAIQKGLLKTLFDGLNR